MNRFIRRYENSDRDPEGVPSLNIAAFLHRAVTVQDLNYSAHDLFQRLATF